MQLLIIIMEYNQVLLGYLYLRPTYPSLDGINS